MEKGRSWIYALIVLLLMSANGQGYISSYPSYETMKAKSDLVVIATPVKRVELNHDAILPGVKSGNNSIPAVSIHTTFRVTTSIVGTLKRDDQFVFLHHREKNPPKGLVMAGPMLIDFKPRDESQWLMFLNRRPDGTYMAYQDVEPGWCVIHLDTPAGLTP